MKRVAVVLSGCGFQDGAEITESVCTLIALSEKQTHVNCFAPDITAPAVDHTSNEAMGQRNALKEAARIARGRIQPLAELKSANYDAVIFPGGYGAATVLCGFAKEGAQCDVLPEARRVIEEFYKDQKPIGAICISPALIARVLGKNGIHVTIGNDPETAKEIEKTGAHHVNCEVTDYITDRESKIVTTPAYMYDAQPHEVFTGIRGAIAEVLEMA